MKKIVVAIIALAMSFSIVFAGEYTAPKNENEYGDVEYFNFDLNIERDGNIVKLKWNDFPSGKGFRWYKVMYSTTIKEPVYPDQNAAYVGARRTDVSHKIALKNSENHYFRICTITMNDDYKKSRYCGKVQKVERDKVQKKEEYIKEEKTYTQRYKDIEYYDFDFKVEITDDKVAKIRWNSYLQNRGFTYYKLMYSTKYANPSYPELSAKYVSSDISDSYNSFQISSGANHYFKICAITDEGYGIIGRYCSKARKLTVEDEGDEKQDSYIKEEKRYNEKKYTQDKYEKKDTSISSELREKIENRIVEFVKNLESKGYSDEGVVEVINSVIGKLEEYKQDPRYKSIAVYMQEILEHHRGEYENELDVFDEIFGEY